MSVPNPGSGGQRPRDLYYFAHPELWPAWPFLPMSRRRTDGDLDLGLLCDWRGLSGRTGYSATVFLCNLLFIPRTEAEFLALPKEVFDTPEEIAAAGWVVD
jgi:hypothetical protein